MRLIKMIPRGLNQFNNKHVGNKNTGNNSWLQFNHAFLSCRDSWSREYNNWRHPYHQLTTPYCGAAPRLGTTVVEQWFSMFGKWRPTQQNIIQFCDPLVLVLVLGSTLKWVFAFWDTLLELISKWWSCWNIIRFKN